MKISILLAVLVLFTASGFRPGEHPAVPAQEAQVNDANIGFDWAFGVMSKKGKNPEPVPITRDTALNSGDEMKMMVRLTKDCFVYVLYYDSEGAIHLLFPYEFRQFETDYTLDKNYYVPKGRMWMRLDQKTGKEKFFLLASSTRLLNLETKLGDYSSASPEQKQQRASDVVTEIREVRKSYASFATLAEKPLTIGGNIRGDSLVVVRRPDVADIATGIEAKNFYSKTFTIDHQ